MVGQALHQIDRPNLVDAVVDEITQAIIHGDLRPGDKLVEERLGEQLGVSRGPVREAIRRLQQMGLVEKIPYQGTFVSKLTERDMVELHSLRVPLECLAVRLLTERQPARGLAELDRLMEAMRQAAAANDRRLIIRLDADFHDSLVNESGHNLLIGVWKVVGAQLRRFLLLKRTHAYGTIEGVLAPHQKIIDAIRSGDPDLAEQAIIEHLTKVESNLLGNLRAEDESARDE